jgi:hypothetical protein
MFIVFMSLHILLCDEVLPYFISRVESRSKFKLVLNSNEFAIRKKGLKTNREFLYSKIVLCQNPELARSPFV